VPHAFTAMDVMLGRLIATQVAFAVERAQAEVTRHRLAAIVNSSDDVIVSKTLDGIITSWNHSAERLFGWTAAGAIGKHITLIIPDDRRSEEDDVLARRHCGAVGLWPRGRAGAPWWLRGASSPPHWMSAANPVGRSHRTTAAMVST
jgi:PAS domain S-box-containing protein